MMSRQDARAPRERARRLAEIDSVEVTIERIVEGGDGLARFEGIPIFVSRAAPGDRVRAIIVQRRRDYARAEIAELLEPGKQRQAPPCDVYDQCGGCDLQHVSDSQLELKVAAASETLRRLGGLHDLEFDVISGPSWGYRTRAQLHCRGGQLGQEDDDAERALESEPLRIGFFRRGTREVVPISSCPILDPRLNALLAELPTHLDGAERIPERLDVTLGDEGVAVAPRVPGLPSQSVTRNIGEFVLEYDARCFFQGNASMLETLVNRVVSSDGGGGDAWDLYAGVGLFTVALAKSYESVTAVDTDRIGARYARRNARRNGLKNVHVEVQSVDGFLERQSAAPDLVVLDPPRGGLSTTALERLVRLRPQRIVYVSCQTPTLARDLRTLTRAYEVSDLTFVDLFPQTAHLEAVTHLRPF